MCMIWYFRAHHSLWFLLFVCNAMACTCLICRTTIYFILTEKCVSYSFVLHLFILIFVLYLQTEYRQSDRHICVHCALEHIQIDRHVHVYAQVSTSHNATAHMLGSRFDIIVLLCAIKDRNSNNNRKNNTTNNSDKSVLYNCTNSTWVLFETFGHFIYSLRTIHN